jgi:RNA polymerase sigma-70 factor (ECF subfamily)
VRPKRDRPCYNQGASKLPGVVLVDDDALIMRQVQAGDVESFAVLMRRYHRPLLRAAFSRLGDRDWAEDVVQEAFMGAFVGRASYNAAFSFRTWLWTILINLCKRHWKRRAAQGGAQPVTAPGDVARAASEPATYSTGLTSLVRAEQIERVRQVLASLPEEQANALRLRFFGELPFSEIAAAMNCSLNTAKSRVRYGLEKVAQVLRPDPEDMP